MTALTDALDAIEATVNAATPGPWEMSDSASYGIVWTTVAESDPEDPTGETPMAVQFEAAHVQRHDDGVFIAAARTVTPALIAGYRAVLALHRPVYPFIQSKAELAACRECREAYTNDWIDYPCDTVRALSTALGVSE